MPFSDEEIRRYARQIVLARGRRRRSGSELRAATVTAASEVEALVPRGRRRRDRSWCRTEAIAEAVRALNPLVRAEVGNVPIDDDRVRRASALFALRAIKETVGL